MERIFKFPISIFREKGNDYITHHYHYYTGNKITTKHYEYEIYVSNNICLNICQSKNIF